VFSFPSIECTTSSHGRRGKLARVAKKTISAWCEYGNDILLPSPTCILPPTDSNDTMAAQGATLQNYNNQLVKCIEDLREKREEVNRQILTEEEEKAKIQKDLSILTDRLSKINQSLSMKNQARNEYDKTIQETEAAYMKILESSQTLLHVLKRESVNLTKKQTSAQ
jgi:sjoegren syndrome nuclear autoantigen 1